MERKVERASALDLKEAENFLNVVFSAHNGYQMDFKTLFPRIFSPDNQETKSYYVVRDNGKIVGGAAGYQLDYNVLGNVLKVSAGGNVAVDSSMRNQGIMGLLLEEIEKVEKEEGFDIAYLHGDRVRYGRFGYECSGVEYNFQINNSLLKDDGSIRVELKELDDNDEGVINKLLEIQKTTNDYLVRDTKEFVLGLHTKSKTPLVIYADGEVVGLMTANVERNVLTDLTLSDNKFLKPALKVYVDTYGVKKMFISIPEYSLLFDEVNKIYDRYTIFQPGNFRIYNFKKVTETFLKAKASYTNLLDGEIIIDSEVFGKWKIQKSGNNISADKFEDDAQFKLEGFTVYGFLFGSANVRTLGLDDKTSSILASWFPLPLYCPYLT